jgi:hypothetical protein
MKMSWTRSSNLAAACCAVWIVCGCGSTHRSSAPEASAQREMESDEEDEDAGEIEVRLDDTPPAVRQAIERELAGAKLEDIAKEQRTDGVVYEADILKDGVKWKLVVAEDGRTLSKREERGAHERKLARALRRGESELGADR